MVQIATVQGSITILTHPSTVVVLGTIQPPRKECWSSFYEVLIFPFFFCFFMIEGSRHGPKSSLRPGLQMKGKKGKSNLKFLKGKLFLKKGRSKQFRKKNTIHNKKKDDTKGCEDKNQNEEDKCMVYAGKCEN